MRPRTLSVVLLFVLITSLTCLSQQTDIRQFSAFGAYSYLSTPSLNLTQQGVDGDFGVNVRSWLTLGADFSYAGGNSTLRPQYLNAATQAKLAPFLPLLPPGYVIAVPYNSSTYTYEAGPQFNYRGLKKVTLFVRPALGALHANVVVKPGDPIAKLLVGQLLGPNPTRTDTVVFYGFGGGLTWEVTPNFGLRAAADLVHYNFFSDLLNGGRNSVRFTVGTKYSFGKNILGK
jgi:hypothetical protein